MSSVALREGGSSSQELFPVTFSSKFLEDNTVIRNFRTTAADGKQYSTNFYNLDAIISIGYRVNSLRATQFRQWATGVLRNFAIPGYVLDKERLKNGLFFSKEYYENLLAEIRVSDKFRLENKSTLKP
ncbi:MAG: RhuM family protein [Victivallales bacterium]